MKHESDFNHSIRGYILIVFVSHFCVEYVTYISGLNLIFLNDSEIFYISFIIYAK